MLIQHSLQLAKLQWAEFAADFCMMFLIDGINFILHGVCERSSSCPEGMREWEDKSAITSAEGELAQ